MFDFLRRRKHEQEALDALLRDHIERSLSRGRSTFQEQLRTVGPSYFERIGFSTTKAAEIFAEAQLYFLLGVFFEIEAELDLPTDSRNRAFLCVIQFLMEDRSLDLEDARRVAINMRSTWNSADPWLDSIIEAGKRAARDGGSDHLLKALNEDPREEP